MGYLDEMDSTGGAAMQPENSLPSVTRRASLLNLDCFLNCHRYSTNNLRIIIHGLEVINVLQIGLTNSLISRGRLRSVVGPQITIT